MLKSKREVGASYNTPLKKFRGHCDKYEVETRMGQFAKEGDRDVVLTFSRITVLDSDSPYAYSAAQLRLKFSDSLSSAWVLFEDSIAATLGKKVEDVSIEDIVGLDLTMEREDKHIFFTDRSGKEATGTVWRVIEAGGKKAGVQAFDKALELLEGKSKGEFIGEAVADAIVRGDSTLQNSILQGTFFEDQRVKDAYTLVDGIYKRS